MGTWFGRLILFGFTFALIHHMLGGIRHLIWDTGALFDKNTSTKLAYATVAGSVALTLLIWVVGYSVR
jgi:succinate dehydrogenase / fumarate reductase cytochrome b subunit